MAHFIYFFSKFTDEAIVFEVFAFFLLVATLTAYYILSKRFLRESDKLIPLSALREYLDKNIVETNEFRMALFGESLNVGELPPGTGPANFVAPTNAADQSKVVELQAQLFNQQKMIEELKAQKQQIETQIAAGGSAPAPAAEGGGGNSAESEDLRARLKNAEDRLAEYSVIEDDLANLKRLQQENAKLKAQLGGAPAPQTSAQAAGAPTPAPQTTVAPPQAAAPAPETQVAPAAPQAAAPEIAAADPFEAAASAAPEVQGPGKDAAPAAGDASQDGNFKDTAGVSASGNEFETAVDQVEAALAPETEAPAAATAAAPTAAPEVAAAAAPASENKVESKPKNDEDLLAEFEKMLGA